MEDTKIEIVFAGPENFEDRVFLKHFMNIIKLTNVKSIFSKFRVIK